MSQINIDEIMKGIALAIKDAQGCIESYSVEKFANCFEEKKDEKSGQNILKPKMIRLPIPDARGHYTEQDIPIVALMNHHDLNLDKVKIRMMVTGSWDDKSKKMQVNVEPIRRKNDSDKKGKEVTYTELEMVFRRTDAPEGISRTLKEHNKVMP
jgi:hypothetical protein